METIDRVISASMPVKNGGSCCVGGIRAALVAMEEISVG
jgi:hypothetical protein